MISRIGEQIEKSGYMKKYIAARLDITPTQLSNWIGGRSYPPADKLFKLAALLGCKVDDLYKLTN
jgi:transcriptional regulator with XRE-family HTH domain